MDLAAQTWERLIRPQNFPKTGLQWTHGTISTSFFAFLPPNIWIYGVKHFIFRIPTPAQPVFFQHLPARRTSFWLKLPRAFSYQKIKHFEILIFLSDYFNVTEGRDKFQFGFNSPCPSSAEKCGEEDLKSQGFCRGEQLLRSVLPKRQSSLFPGLDM